MAQRVAGYDEEDVYIWKPEYRQPDDREPHWVV